MTRAAACAVVLAAGLALPASQTPRVVTPFDGTTFKGWEFKTGARTSHWVIGIPAVDPNDNRRLLVRMPAGKADEVNCMVNEKADGADAYTKEAFDDCRVELEFLVPPAGASAVYLLGEYGVRLADNTGKDKLDNESAGAILRTAPPKAAAAKKGGEWQRLVVDFQAPRFDDKRPDLKRANAKFLRVELNGVLVQEGVEVKATTAGGLTDKELPAGPLMLQGSAGPSAFRNIKITAKRG